MPLAFESLSHGTIAFGFFNIDSDMLLLEKHFLFGSEFCEHISEIAENCDADQFESSWSVYTIEDRAQIGDLMGAIRKYPAKFIMTLATCTLQPAKSMLSWMRRPSLDISSKTGFRENCVFFRKPLLIFM